MTTLSNFIRNENINRIDLLKLDCEGHEMEVLMGIEDEHWAKIHAIVMEIHDIESRAEIVEELLRNKGFTNLLFEKEEALIDTELINLYATR